MTYQSDMKRLTVGLSTKSDKIRALGRAGYPRQQIADFLGIRYQHVRNVLVDAERKGKAGELAEPKPNWRSEEPAADASGKIRVRTDGSAVVPADMLAAAGFGPGDTIVTDAAGEGDLRLLSGRAALRRAQEIVRQYVPENVSLVDELIKERRREVEKDENERSRSR